MRIDVHTHIFPPEIVQNRSRFFSTEPVFELLYSAPKSKMVTVGGLIAAMDEDEVDRAVVFGFPWRGYDTAVMHNDYVLEAASKFPLRLIPLACFDPLAFFAADEAERCLHAGAKGLGELAVYSECDTATAMKAFASLFEQCRAHNSIALVHANEPVGHAYPGKAPQGLDFYYELARLASGIPLILAHWGGGLCFYELLKKEASDVLRNVYYDTAASPYLYKHSIYSQMSNALAKGKILFGSDYPLLAPRRYFQDMAEAQLTPEEVNDISGGNAARLFG